MATFEECGIKWLSVASVDNYAENPAHWVVRYLHGVKGNYTSPAVIRAEACKQGARAWLCGIQEDNAIIQAISNFQLNVVGGTTEEVEKEQDAIMPMLQRFFKLLEPVEMRKAPVAFKQFDEVWLDGISAPFTCKPDFIFDDAVLMLKTTHKLPSQIRQKEAMEAALSWIKRPYPVWVCYVTPKKALLEKVSIHQMTLGIEKLRRDALALQTFVSRVDSPNHALAQCPIKPDHYLWSPDQLSVAMSSISQLENQETPDGLRITRQ